MPTLNFYDAQVEYGGKLLGMYQPRDRSLLSTCVPEFATMDPHQMVQLATRIGQEEFVAGVKQHLSWMELQLDGYNPFLPLGDIRDPVYVQSLKSMPEDHRTGIHNAKDFLGEVLTALGGE